MKKSNKVFNLFTLIFLVSSFLFAPVNLVYAEDAKSGATADSGKDKDGEEEPECD